MVLSKAEIGETKKKQKLKTTSLALPEGEI
jgi:hypothetical protein